MAYAFFVKETESLFHTVSEDLKTQDLNEIPFQLLCCAVDTEVSRDGGPGTARKFTHLDHREQTTSSAERSSLSRKRNHCS